MKRLWLIPLLLTACAPSQNWGSMVELELGATGVKMPTSAPRVFAGPVVTQPWSSPPGKMQLVATGPWVRRADVMTWSAQKTLASAPVSGTSALNVALPGRVRTSGSLTDFLNDSGMTQVQGCVPVIPLQVSAPAKVQPATWRFAYQLKSGSTIGYRALPWAATRSGTLLDRQTGALLYVDRDVQARSLLRCESPGRSATLVTDLRLKRGWNDVTIAVRQEQVGKTLQGSFRLVSARLDAPLVIGLSLSPI